MKRVYRRGVRPWLPGLLALPYSSRSLALNTAAIVPTVSSPNCLEYQVVDGCYWLRCTHFDCVVKPSANVRHDVPDAVVSSYCATSQPSWTEVRTLWAPIAEAQGASGTTNSTRDFTNGHRMAPTPGHYGVPIAAANRKDRPSWAAPAVNDLTRSTIASLDMESFS